MLNIELLIFCVAETDGQAVWQRAVGKLYQRGQSDHFGGAYAAVWLVGVDQIMATHPRMNTKVLGNC
eukprot:4652182-Pleurochrysis_carterae.AAC.1